MARDMAEQAKTASPMLLAGASTPSMKDRLEMEKANLESRLAEVNEGLELLAKYPDIQRLMSIVSGNRY